MADKQIKQFNEETTVNTGDWYIMQKASTDETVKVAGENIVPSGTIDPSKLATGATTATVSTSENTVSLTYVDLATVGPSVTVTIGANGIALVAISARMQESVGSSLAAMSFAVSGANTIAANDATAIWYQAYANGAVDIRSGVFVLTGLTPGSTTFTAKYQSIVSGTSTYQDRRLSVIPL